MNIKKKNALFGKYPSCDLLNNALRFIRNGNVDAAIDEIIFAIEKADGYFHEDNIQFINDTKARWTKAHMTFDEAIEEIKSESPEARETIEKAEKASKERTDLR